MKSILFVEQFFWPEGWPGARIPQQIVSYLCSDYDITVLCGNRPYIISDDSILNPPKSKYSINHLYLPCSSHKSIARVINQLFFCIQLFFFILRNRPSLIISQTNPPLALFVLPLAKYFFHVPYIIVCMDLYPDVLISSLNSNTIGVVLRKLLDPIFSLIYNSASYVVSIDRSMSSSLRKYIKFPGKIKLIYNWSILPPPSLLKTYTSSKTSTPSIPDSKVQLLYSRTLAHPMSLQQFLNPYQFST